MANPANSTAYQLGDGRMAVDVTEAKTLTVDDCGYVQNVTYADGVVTLPATATLGTWTIRNKGLSPSGGATGAVIGGNTVSVSPNSVDQISGGVSGTPTDDKDLISSNIGDEVTVTNGATNGAIVTRIVGAGWARQA